MSRSKLPEKPEIYNGWLDASNAKAAKGRKLGWLSAIHYVAPHKQGGAGNVCPWAARCIAPCLTSSGKGGAPSVIKGRQSRAVMLMDSIKNDGCKTYCDLHRLSVDNPRSDINLMAVAKAYGLKPSLRLNGTSDIPYERYDIFQSYPNLAKYDYTKGHPRMLDWLRGRRHGGHSFRSNGGGHFSDVEKYHLTLSLGGTLDDKADRAGDVYEDVLNHGGNVAAVWADKATALKVINGPGIDRFIIHDKDGNPTKEILLGGVRKVIDGNDMNGDMRFLDPEGVIVGLYAKGHTWIKDAGRGFDVKCPKGHDVTWSGVPGDKARCVECGHNLTKARQRLEGPDAPRVVFTWKPKSRGAMNMEWKDTNERGERFFQDNPSSRRSSRSSSSVGLVTDGLPMGSMKQDESIHIDINPHDLAVGSLQRSSGSR